MTVFSALATSSLVLPSPGHVWLLNIDLQPITLGRLIPLVALIGAVLAYCSFTDLHRGRDIPNAATAGLFLLSLATSFLVLAHPGKQLLGGAIMIVVAGFLCFGVGAFAEGDFKLYAALAPLLGFGTFAFMLLSWLAVMVYSLPLYLQHRKAKKAGQATGLTKVPAGPGIAAAWPLTLWFAGAQPTLCLLLAGWMVLVYLGTHATTRLLARLDQEEQRLQDREAAEAFEIALAHEMQENVALAADGLSESEPVPETVAHDLSRPTRETV